PPVSTPRDAARDRGERVHRRLLLRRVARVARVAAAVRVPELAERRAAVDPLAVESGRADEAARVAAEDDVRPPHELAATILGQTIQDVVRPVLAADPDP